MHLGFEVVHELVFMLLNELVFVLINALGTFGYFLIGHIIGVLVCVPVKQHFQPVKLS